MNLLQNFRLSSEKSKKFIVDLISNVVDTITGAIEDLDNAKSDKNHNNINCGKFVHDSDIIDDNSCQKINTGFSATPKVFKLYFWDTDNSKPELAVEYRPNLAEPFNQIIYNNFPINNITFDGGVATIKWYTSTGLSMMWEAYM